MVTHTTQNARPAIADRIGIVLEKVGKNNFLPLQECPKKLVMVGTKIPKNMLVPLFSCFISFFFWTQSKSVRHGAASILSGMSDYLSRKTLSREPFLSFALKKSSFWAPPNILVTKTWQKVVQTYFLGLLSLPIGPKKRQLAAPHRLPTLALGYAANIPFA